MDGPHRHDRTEITLNVTLSQITPTHILIHSELLNDFGFDECVACMFKECVSKSPNVLFLFQWLVNFRDYFWSSDDVAASAVFDSLSREEVRSKHLVATIIILFYLCVTLYVNNLREHGDVM